MNSPTQWFLLFQLFFFYKYTKYAPTYILFKHTTDVKFQNLKKRKRDQASYYIIFSWLLILYPSGNMDSFILTEIRCALG